MASKLIVCDTSEFPEILPSCFQHQRHASTRTVKPFKRGHDSFSAAGAHFHVRMSRDVELAELKGDIDGRVSFLGLDPRGEVDYLDVDMTKPVALMVGNEAFGIIEEDRGLLDGTIHIGMPGRSESLNVASAAAVVLFEAIRQRGQLRSGDR